MHKRAYHRTMTEYPEWVLKKWIKGTFVMRREDHYYLYRVSRKWSPEKKRALLKTGVYKH
jgi:hypothetical protein